MSTPARPDPEAGARFLEKLMAEDPARLDVATDEQVDAMMDAAGIEVGEPESAEAALARGERRARERAARQRVANEAKPRATAPKKASRSRVPWAAGAIVATAAAAAVVAVEIERTRSREPEAIGPDRPGPVLTPQQQAERLREVALRACAAQDWDGCRQRLDEARTFDPAGESDPRVVEARKNLSLRAVPSVAPVAPSAPASARTTDKPPKPQ